MHNVVGARAAAVQAALSKQLENQKDVPMSSRRNFLPQPTVLSPSTSFVTDENGSVPTTGTPADIPATATVIGTAITPGTVPMVNCLNLCNDIHEVLYRLNNCACNDIH